MSDPQQPWLERPETDRPEPERPKIEQAEFPQPALPPERVPFWGYNDLLLFIGLTPVCLILGLALVKLPLRILHIHPSVQVVEALTGELLGYLLLFGALRIIFLQWYGRPFWASLGWRSTRLPAGIVAFIGMLTAVIVVVASSLIHLPDTPNPLTEMMQTRTAILLMAIFGTTVAPVCEELAFRGFLQPLLARSLGAAPAVLLAAIPFGLLHYPEYGDSWRHALIISAAGAAFGAMRQFTGSTKAAALMHASYNAFFFLALLSDGKDLPHSW